MNNLSNPKNSLVHDEDIPHNFIKLILVCPLLQFFQAEYLPPYYPNDEEKKDAKLYALNVREYMCAATNLHMSEFSNHDVLLQNEAMKVC